MTREQKLMKAGRQKRSHFDEPRLSEVIKMYRDVGFEVHTEPVILEDLSGCIECMKVDLDRYQMVYTRNNNDEVDD
jgi:hypothetical protein